MNIVQRTTDNRYCLGVECFELGNFVASHWVLEKEAQPFVKQLWEKTQETINLTVIDSDELLYIDSIASPKRLGSRSLTGVKAPLHCTGVGKAIMAFLPENKVDEIIKEKGLKRFTKNTITEPEKLKEHLRLIRARGYAIDNMEIEEGLRCIGAPIRNHSGVVFASISISGPKDRITETNVPELAKLVISTANDISKALENRMKVEVESRT
jgi:DNA-binding IclR family transcriptional regulator